MRNDFNALKYRGTSQFLAEHELSGKCAVLPCSGFSTCVNDPIAYYQGS